MSVADYSLMSTSKLIDRFIDEANHIGGPLSPTGLKMPVRSEGFVAGKDVLQAIAAVLRTRQLNEAILAQLYENESPDVRSWAGTLLHFLDPNWASAAITGLFRGLTTREVLIWRERVLGAPPRQPALKKMTTIQLLKRFVDACERCYGATRFLTDEQGGGLSMGAYNKVSGEPYAVAKELNARGELKTLVPLLDHPLVTVREKTAMFCLDIATDRAVAALESLDGANSRHEAVEGATMLMLWRMGHYKPLSE